MQKDNKESNMLLTKCLQNCELLRKVTMHLVLWKSLSIFCHTKLWVSNSFLAFSCKLGWHRMVSPWICSDKENHQKQRLCCVINVKWNSSYLQKQSHNCLHKLKVVSASDLMDEVIQKLSNRYKLRSLNKLFFNIFIYNFKHP